MFCFHENGPIESLRFRGLTVPFSSAYPTAFTITEGEEKREIPLLREGMRLSASENGIRFEIKLFSEGDADCMHLSVANLGDAPFSPTVLAVRLGIDSYMAQFPQWNEMFFPTYLRIEKRHFHGYFMSPSRAILGVSSDEPFASYSLSYNKNGVHLGHRILGTELELFNTHPLPEGYPELPVSLAPGERITRTLRFYPLPALDEYARVTARMASAPILSLPRTALAVGETASIELASDAPATLSVTDPRGNEVALDRDNSFPLLLRGEYLITAKDKNGKTARARIIAHAPFRDHLDRARRAAYLAPQKATTHAESYYGFYSAFLAAKHMPNLALDGELLAEFHEVMPLMFDMDRGLPLLIPHRIQNTATALGILTDLYESDPARHRWALAAAGRLAEYLISCQSEDGAYRRDTSHYTCVIYIAKSMLELALAERGAGGEFAEAGERHYASARRAVDDLVEHLDNIGTEGEQTFEDGMISCSALQIGMFALTLPEGERPPYIAAAEYMIAKHACLEARIVPDYRMRGGSLRFWEAQYDVMTFANFMNSPHGWTAWTAYATYYLYLLTGEEQYLADTYNTLGACTALMREDGELAWAFAVDPWIIADCFVPDMTKRVEDAYLHTPNTPACRERIERKCFGECYLPMISTWYRTGKGQPVTGGYSFCGLIYGPDTPIDYEADAQGGCCDNDVHEIFKCLEETLFDKIFLLEREDGSLAVYGAPASYGEDGLLHIQNKEGAKHLFVNLKRPAAILLDGKRLSLSSKLRSVKL